MARTGKRTRRGENKRYRPRIVVATEGDVTEAKYLNRLPRAEGLSLKILPSRKKSSPDQVLKRLQAHLKTRPLGRLDCAWAIVDEDLWTAEQFRSLEMWAANSPRHHVAISYPKFERWLLLHLENPKGVNTADEVEQRLKHFKAMNGKDPVSGSFADSDAIAAAIERARKKAKLPRPAPVGDVYLLVEMILGI